MIRAPGAKPPHGGVAVLLEPSPAEAEGLTKGQTMTADNEKDTIVINRCHQCRPAAGRLGGRGPCGPVRTEGPPAA